MRPIAEQLAYFACAIDVESVPAEVIEDNKLRVLDALGLAMSSAPQEFAERIRRLAHGEMEQHLGTVADGRRLAPSDVGLVLGALIHGQDFDDTHTETLIHPSACIAAAGLALAGAKNLDGGQLLSLLAIGYEVIIRIGRGSGPGAQIQARGFHGTSIAGACAVAVMCALTWTRDPERVRDALALAAGLAAGLRESVIDGSFAKPIQPGWAVKTGFWAADAAKAGITGPALIFEGSRGLYASHAGLDRCEPERAIDQLGDRWEHLNTDFKLYPVCHFLQAPVEAALSIREELGPNGNLEVIREVEVELSEQQVLGVCEPRESRLVPANVYGARFSLPFIVALTLAYGRVGEEEIGRGLRDERVLGLARRVVHRGVQNDNWPRVMPIEVHTKTTDGRVINRSLASSPGIYGRPVGPKDIEEKFRKNAQPCIDARRAEEIVTFVRKLEVQPDLTDVLGTVVKYCVDVGSW